MTPAIEVSGLTKRYDDDTLAASDVSFVVVPGTVCALVGPNGSGKTTTINVMLGLVYADSGSISILGRRYVELADPLRSVGAVVDSIGFNAKRTARSHLLYLAVSAGIGRTRINEVLELVELGGVARKKVGTFSLGMRQRLKLAGALLGDPEVLVLDEPANGLDPAGQQWLRVLVRGYASSGRAVLLSSHSLRDVERVADQIVVMAEGHVISNTTRDELLAGRGKVRVRARRLPALMAALDGEQLAYREDRGDLVVAGTTTDHISDVASAAGVRLTLLAEDAVDLERVYFELVRRAKAGVAS